MNKINNRKISLDILRILAMFGIIGLHLIGQGGIIKNLNMHSIRTYIILIIYVICYLSVNTFGVLSGYLSWKKEKVNYKRIVELIFITIFYAFLLTAIFYIFNFYDFRSLGKENLIHCLFPALIGKNWYIVCYIFLFFLIPYLNYFINNISKEKFKQMLIIIFIFLSVLPNIFHLTDFFKVFNGYSPFWLIYCYLLGAYIGKYLDKNKISKKMILTLIECLIASFVLNSLVRIITPKIYGKIKYESWFISYISPFTLIASMIMVKIFSKIKLNINNKIIYSFILSLSAHSFAVYIIHSHNVIFDLVLTDIMVKYIWGNMFVLIGMFFFGLLFIYIICYIIDIIRSYLFKLCRINTLIDKIGSKLNKQLN